MPARSVEAKCLLRTGVMRTRSLSKECQRLGAMLLQGHAVMADMTEGPRGGAGGRCVSSSSSSYASGLYRLPNWYSETPQMVATLLGVWASQVIEPQIFGSDNYPVHVVQLINFLLFPSVMQHHFHSFPE
jgi:hypothetical protein